MKLMHEEWSHQIKYNQGSFKNNMDILDFPDPLPLDGDGKYIGKQSLKIKSIFFPTNR